MLQDVGGNPERVRIVDDADARVFGVLNADDTHPHRQKELIERVNAEIGPETHVNSYDVQCVRVVHDISPETNPELCHKPKHGTLQYSENYVDWIVAQHTRSPEFFVQARATYYQRSKQRA